MAKNKNKPITAAPESFQQFIADTMKADEAMNYEDMRVRVRRQLESRISSRKALSWGRFFALGLMSIVVVAIVTLGPATPIPSEREVERTEVDVVGSESDSVSVEQQDSSASEQSSSNPAPTDNPVQESDQGYVNAINDTDEVIADIKLTLAELDTASDWSDFEI